MLEIKKWDAPDLFPKKAIGTVAKNRLSKEEFELANEIVGKVGGHFEGQIAKNLPGIDGYLNATVRTAF